MLLVGTTVTGDKKATTKLQVNKSSHQELLQSKRHKDRLPQGAEQEILLKHEASRWDNSDR